MLRDRKLTENVVLSQRIEENIEGRHLESAFFLLLLFLNDILDERGLGNGLLSSSITHFRGCGTSLRTPVGKAAKLNVSVEDLHGGFCIINLN
jgi:hypothetical protein